MEAKTLDNTNVEEAAKNVSDIKVFGNGDMFQLLCKASSAEQGWMKSTKACEIPGSGCIVQVSTQQRNPDGSYAVAEACCFVPYVKIQTLYGPVPEGVTEFQPGDYPVFGRQLVQDPDAFLSMSSELVGGCCGEDCECQDGEQEPLQGEAGNEDEQQKQE